MSRYVEDSTRRLAQLTGDKEPDSLPHVNFTGSWGCLGVDLGTNTIHDDATFVVLRRRGHAGRAEEFLMSGRDARAGTARK